MSRLTALFSLIFLLSPLSHSSNDQSSYAKDVLGACKAEVKDHCHDKNLTSEEIADCLKVKSQNQKNKFTDSCRDSLAKKK
jgi:hypothetical protein